jgi:citrate lyase subunit beta/citryl-CoA lyase
MLEKARGCGADAVIVDLEDSVPLREKDAARERTRSFIAEFGSEHVLYVRVNSLPSLLLDDDLDAVVVEGLSGIQLPKVSDPDTVSAVAERVALLEQERSLPDGSVELLVSLESARGVLHAHELLSASPRVGSVMPGIAENGDLQRELGCEYTPDEIAFLYARSHVLLAARAVGISNPIDGVYSRIGDDAGFTASATIARTLGYRGKKVIHPSQVALANRIFMPTQRELEFHARVLEALEEAAERGSAATVVDGLMVDTAMVETARSVLAWAKEIEAT